MFVKGKVYKTVNGDPAKVLWIAPRICELYGYMCVLHGAYTLSESGFLHMSDSGQYFGEASVDDLTEELYNA